MTTQLPLEMAVAMTGTGLAGRWLVGSRVVLPGARGPRAVMLRADMELDGSLGEVMWDDEILPADVAAVRRYVWRSDGSLRPGSSVGRWRRLAHLLVAACGPDVVAVAGWMRPIVEAPGVRCVRVQDALGDVVRAHQGGECVALIRGV